VIAVIYGTTGELIKLAPILLRLREADRPFLQITTGQQTEQIPTFVEGFGLPQPDIWLAHGSGGRDLRAQREVPRWFADVLGAFARQAPGVLRRLRAGDGQPLILVHGDTMTTVIGAVMGRLLRAEVAHVESGLRSFDLRHPFPEELNRRMVSRIARIHYAPGPSAAANLAGRVVVDTGSNTVCDSLDLVPENIPLPFEPPPSPFGIVSLHRNELLSNRTLFASTLTILAERAQRTRLLFVDHSVTVDALAHHDLGGAFDGDRFRRIPRLGFFEFVALMRRSAFLVTDSGGSQEETYYLNLPCLVHRKRTERNEGLGETAVLSRYDQAVLRDFLVDPGRFRRRQPLPSTSPSHTIVEDLTKRGFV
jgi:UDP-N-acetylglucosamine 2-epimerase (non-hydrolysing)